MHSRRTSAFARIALALGLLSAVLHASVFTWHANVRSWTQSADQALLAELQAAICHGSEAGGVEAPIDRNVPPSPDPRNDCPHCLLCKRLSGAWQAIPAPVALSAPAPLLVGFVVPVAVDAFVAAPLAAPRNRGPPLTA